jgi:hypothetical protein
MLAENPYHCCHHRTISTRNNFSPYFVRWLHFYVVARFISSIPPRLAHIGRRHADKASMGKSHIAAPNRSPISSVAVSSASAASDAISNNAKNKILPLKSIRRDHSHSRHAPFFQSKSPSKLSAFGTSTYRSFF